MTYLYHNIYRNDGSHAWSSLEGLNLQSGLFQNHDWFNINFNYANFSNSDFSGSNMGCCHLSYADLRGTNFAGAKLTDALFYHSHFENTNFIGADLRGAKFSGPTGQCDFTGAFRNLTDPRIQGWAHSHTGIMRKLRPGQCASCDNTDITQIRACGDCCFCCEHSLCSSCDNCSDSVCQWCEDCSDCCSCSICDMCDNLQNCNGSEDCGYCRNHCDCEVEVTMPTKVWLDKRSKLFKCTRLCGVEWEYNGNQDLYHWKRNWNGITHSDISCRGNEAVTRPMAGDYIRKCLQELGDTMNRNGVSCDNSCGIHVHVDAGDLSWTDMYRLLWVYGKIEPLLYLLAGQHRALPNAPDGEDESYCKPVGIKYLKSLADVDRKGSVLATAFDDADSRTPAAARSRLQDEPEVDKKDSGRYRGLNIIPWLAGKTRKAHAIVRKPDSTVEFRMHRNSLNTERVINWTELCTRIVDWCAKASDKEAHELPKSALRALCEVIAPDKASWILSRVKEWRKVTPYRKKIRRLIGLKKGVYTLKVRQCAA